MSIIYDFSSGKAVEPPELTEREKAFMRLLSTTDDLVSGLTQLYDYFIDDLTQTEESSLRGAEDNLLAALVLTKELTEDQ